MKQQGTRTIKALQGVDPESGWPCTICESNDWSTPTSNRARWKIKIRRGSERDGFYVVCDDHAQKHCHIHSIPMPEGLTK